MADEMVAKYWGSLNAIDHRFPIKGLLPTQQKHFVPLGDVSERLDELRTVMTDFAARAREVSEKLGS